MSAHFQPLGLVLPPVCDCKLSITLEREPEDAHRLMPSTRVSAVRPARRARPRKIIVAGQFSKRPRWGAQASASLAVRYLPGPESPLSYPQSKQGTAMAENALDDTDTLEQLMVDRRLIEMCELQRASDDLLDVVTFNENQHSATLAWMFDGREGHGQGDEVLRDLLAYASVQARAEGPLAKSRSIWKFFQEWPATRINEALELRLRHAFRQWGKRRPYKNAQCCQTKSREHQTQGRASPTDAYLARLHADCSALHRRSHRRCVSVLPSHLDGSADQSGPLISSMVTPSS
jgi:hypothetical protein